MLSWCWGLPAGPSLAGLALLTYGAPCCLQLCMGGAAASSAWGHGVLCTCVECTGAPCRGPLSPLSTTCARPCPLCCVSSLFRPELYWWRLVLTVRKFCIVAVALLFSSTPLFQAW